MEVSNRNLLFQGSTFRCYVSFREGKDNDHFLGIYHEFYPIIRSKIQMMHSSQVLRSVMIRSVLIRYLGLPLPKIKITAITICFGFHVILKGHFIIIFAFENLKHVFFWNMTTMIWYTL